MIRGFFPNKTCFFYSILDQILPNSLLIPYAPTFHFLNKYRVLFFD